jgi:hypothetical protein
LGISAEVLAWNFALQAELAESSRLMGQSAAASILIGYAATNRSAGRSPDRAKMKAPTRLVAQAHRSVRRPQPKADKDRSGLFAAQIYH